MIEASLTTIEILSVIAFFAGCLSAVAGSSGIIILPSLLMTGLPPYFALGTNKLFTTVSLSTSAYFFIKRGLFKPQYWLAAIFATVIGAVLGVMMTQIFAVDHIKQILPPLIALVAAYLIFHKKILKWIPHRQSCLPNSFVTVCISIVLGIYSGFLGAGTGAIWTLMATYLFKVDLLEASALSRFMCFVSNLVALCVFIYFQHVYFLLGICLAIFGAMGAYVGTKLTIRAGNSFIRVALSVVTIAMSANLAIDNWIYA